MQSISLVPSTAYNTSIYVANRKNCSGGSIVLEDRITDYFLPISETTAVSVDTSLLHPLPNSSIKFTLIVNSIGSNVLNLSGFEVNQIQVLDGMSIFTVQKGLGEAVWSIQMKSSDIRPERWLRCFELTYNPYPNAGIFCYFNTCFTSGERRELGLLSDFAPGQTDSNAYYGAFVKNDGTAEVCIKFQNPIWLKAINTSVTTNTSISLESFPNLIQVYGTNDGLTWTQILSTAFTAGYGSTDTFNCLTTNYYTMFKLKFNFPNNASVLYLPAISLTGFLSELIAPGGYSLATPLTSTLPVSGYDIESNATDMISTGNSITWLTKFSGGDSYYSMRRISQDTPFEFIFTFPEAIRTIGFVYKLQDNPCIKLFSLSYSDDKTNWTEYCKVDGTLNAWSNGVVSKQLAMYWYDSASEHKYYKISIHSLANNANEIYIFGLEFIQFQKGKYLTFESFVPQLKSNSQGGYMLIASNTSQGDAYQMFDHALNTYGGGNITNGEWSLSIILPQATIVKGIELVSPSSGYDRMPYDFSFQGSTDNETWTNIKTFYLGSNYWSSPLQIGQWEIDNTTSYQYYRFVVTATAAGSTVRIGEIGLSSYPSFKGVDWYEDEYLIPVMSSNSQDGYIASASSTYSGTKTYHPFEAFNRVVSDYSSWESGEQPAWLQIEMPTAKVANLLQIGGTYTKEEPQSFTLYGSNDGINFTEILIESNLTWTHNELKTWNLTNTTEYKYYRLGNLVNARSQYVGVSEFTLINRIYHEGD